MRRDLWAAHHDALPGIFPKLNLANRVFELVSYCQLCAILSRAHAHAPPRTRGEGEQHPANNLDYDCVDLLWVGGGRAVAVPHRGW